MHLEAAIRRALDGTFTRLTFSAEHGVRAVTKSVAADFVPEYNAPVMKRREASLGRGVARKPWLASDDSLLLELRRAGVPLAACTARLCRGIKQVRARIKLLGGV